MVTVFSAPVNRIPCGVLFFYFLQPLSFRSHRGYRPQTPHSSDLFHRQFFSPQTSPSAHWILHCDPEIGQRLKAINYASRCVLVERKRHNAVLLFAIIPGCFLLCGEHSLFFYFFQNISMLSFKQWQVAGTGTSFSLQNKITPVLCSRLIVHYGREGTFFLLISLLPLHSVLIMTWLHTWEHTQTQFR